MIICVTGNALDANDRDAFLHEHGFDDMMTKGSEPSVFDVLSEFGRLRKLRQGME